MPANRMLIDAVNRAAMLLDLPPLLIKAFIAVEGANINHRDGVLQVIPTTRAGVITRIERGVKLAALGLDGSALSDDELSARFAQAFDAKNALVQVLAGAQYIKEQLNHFNGFVALAGLAYNAGPGRAASEIQKWGGDPRALALQYHKSIGPAGSQVTVQAGIVQTDPATGAKWTRFPVIANDTGREIFQYLYLRRVPGRNWGLLDFLFNPMLLNAVGLFENDAPPSEDWPTRALVATDGEFRFSQESTSNIMFNTKPLSQRDPAWANVSLGFADAGQTLGSYGCTVTVLTMMANGFGFQETPATLNEKLRALGPNQGFFGPLVAWYGVPRALPGITLNKLVDCRKSPAPMAEIDAALDAGKPIVAEVDMSPNPNLQNHWVLIYARQGGDYLIHDPWPVPAEASASLKQRYGFAGDPAQIVTFCAFFDNPNFHGQPQPPNDDKLVVVVTDSPDIVAAGGLALRDQPNAVGSQILTRLSAGTVLELQEPASTARQKIGVYGQWLNVTTPDNKAGWVAAWYVTGKAISAIDKGLEIPVQPPLLERRFVVIGKSFSGVYIRAKGQAGSTVITKVKGGTRLEALDPEDVLQKKVGTRGQWLKVSTSKGEIGYISAQYVELYTPPASRKPQTDSGKGGMELMAVNEPDAQPALRVTSDVGVNLRDAPSMTANRIRVLPFGTVVLLREPLDTAQPKLGKAGTWVAVRTLDGITGFVSGEWVELLFAPPTDPSQPIDPDVQKQGVALAVSDVALMNGAGDNTGSEWRVTAGTPLRLLNRDADWGKIGNSGAWIQVESYAFKRGFVRGSALRAPDVADRRQRVLDGPLPYGICAWLYGLHDEFDKGLFAGSGKTGWVLMTHRVQNGEGRDYNPWARAGYGVIARLNNDYGGSGTIPTPDKFDEFAAQCRSWAANSRGCLIYVIGNEMNNPREWPNQDPWNPGNNPNAAITPELYAACFNRVRAAIKSVQPNAIVVPGAVDPFQGPWMSSLDYFNRMLAAIDLDGLALHCYTNGYTPDLITSLQRFENDPLRWQYYHFRSYTTFLDAIPPRHRNKPVYITETDPHGAQPWAGGQNGWVQAAYAEIDRYNLQARAQQIQCAILYRWSKDDIYSIVDKPGVQNDIRATINGSDYRWRA